MFEALIEKIKSAYFKIKSSLKKVQRAEEKTKKRWLISLTTCAMILVIGLWLIFINNFSLPNIAPASPSTTSSLPAGQAGAAAAPKQDSIWQTFKRGFNEIIENAKEQISSAKKSLEEQIQKSNETVIKNQNVLPLTPPSLATSTATTTH